MDSFSIEYSFNKNDFESIKNEVPESVNKVKTQELKKIDANLK